MIGIPIKHGFIDFGDTNFKCPYCSKKYNDDSLKYLDSCNKNKRGITSIKCSCGNKFNVTYSYMSNAVSFK